MNRARVLLFFCLWFFECSSEVPRSKILKMLGRIALALYMIYDVLNKLIMTWNEREKLSTYLCDIAVVFKERARKGGVSGYPRRCFLVLWSRIINSSLVWLGLRIYTQRKKKNDMEFVFILYSQIGLTTFFLIATIIVFLRSGKIFLGLKSHEFRHFSKESVPQSFHITWIEKRVCKVQSIIPFMMSIS